MAESISQGTGTRCHEPSETRERRLSENGIIHLSDRSWPHSAKSASAPIAMPSADGLLAPIGTGGSLVMLSCTCFQGSSKCR